MKTAKAIKTTARNAFAPQTAQDLAKLKRIKDHLALSPTGAALLKWARANNVSFVIDPAMSETAGAFYHRASNAVILNGKLPEHLQASTMGHEIRHAWQNLNDFWPTALRPPDDTLICMRLLEADACAHHIQIATELSLAGHHDAWEFWMQSALYSTMLQRCADSYQRNPDNLSNKQAMLSVFYTWFENRDLKNYYDGRNLQHYINGAKTYLGEEVPNKDIPVTSSLIQTFAEKAARKKQPPPSKGIDFRNRKAFMSLTLTLDGDQYLRNLPKDYFKNWNEIFNVGSGMGYDERRLHDKAWNLYQHIEQIIKPSPTAPRLKRA